MKTATDVWLVADSGDVQVFANKPARVTRENGYGSSYKAWADTTVPQEDNDEALALFCESGFRKATGIRVPKRPVRARVTLIKERKK